MPGSNEQRQANTTKAITDKVRVLQQIREGLRPYVDGLPTSMNEFRSWVNEDLGVVRIGSSTSTNVTESPHHEILIDDANAVMKSLCSMKAQRKLKVYVSVGEQANSLARTNKELKEELRRMTSQALTFKHQLNNTITKLKQAESDLETMAQGYNALRAEHVGLTNGKPRRVK